MATTATKVKLNKKRCQSGFDGISYEYIRKLRITRIEINITLPCVGKATPSDMTHLFDMVYDRTTVYRKRKKGSKCEKVNTGTGGYGRDHYYTLKLYDKFDDFERQEIPDETIYKCRKKELGLPEDVLKTLKAFHIAAG